MAQTGQPIPKRCVAPPSPIFARFSKRTGSRPRPAPLDGKRGGYLADFHRRQSISPAPTEARFGPRHLTLVDDKVCSRLATDLNAAAPGRITREPPKCRRWASGGSSATRRKPPSTAFGDHPCEVPIHSRSGFRPPIANVSDGTGVSRDRSSASQKCGSTPGSIRAGSE